jgi:hypothetical protein
MLGVVPPEQGVGARDDSAVGSANADREDQRLRVIITRPDIGRSSR